MIFLLNNKLKFKKKKLYILKYKIISSFKKIYCIYNINKTYNEIFFFISSLKKNYNTFITILN